MGISRDSWHKRRSTGGRKAQLRKKRKFELGRPPAMTRIGAKRIHLVRTRGGNEKKRALRLETGNFSWGSEGMSARCCVCARRFLFLLFFFFVQKKKCHAKINATRRTAPHADSPSHVAIAIH
jgi:hypothetical protein